MKLLSTLPLLAAFAFSTSVFAQADTHKSADSKPMHGTEMKEGKEMKPGMDMKHMDMDDCMHMKGMEGMDMKGMDMKHMDAKKCKEMMGKMKKDKSGAHTGVHAADAVVKSVDSAGKVTLQHGPVKSLGWPAMSMGFAVKDKALMDKLAVGSKVHVEFDKQGDDYVITSVK